MSLERIRALQGHGEVGRYEDTNFHIIIPGINFTCNGNIHSWIFGANWYGNNQSYLELQIWRSSGNGSYTKVGSTTITTEENTTQLYKYPLSSPLRFQEGDFLGYYLPSRSRSQLRLKLEENYGPKEYFKEHESDIFIKSPVSLHPLLAVETGEPQDVKYL